MINIIFDENKKSPVTAKPQQGDEIAVPPVIRRKIRPHFS
jgi:hypothetical protein